MCEILDHVDFERIRNAAPKWFMGYSDNTNMTYPLATLADTASIYGPCAAAFGMEPWHPALHDALGILTGQVSGVSGYDLWEKESLKDETNPLAPYHVTQPRVLKRFPDQDASFRAGFWAAAWTVLSTFWEPSMTRPPASSTGIRTMASSGFWKPAT